MQRPMTIMKTIPAFVLIMSLMGCDSAPSSSNEFGEEQQHGIAKSALIAAEDCDQVLGALKSKAKKEMEEIFNSERSVDDDPQGELFKDWKGPPETEGKTPENDPDWFNEMKNE